MTDTAIVRQQTEDRQLLVPEPFQAPGLFQALFWKPHFLVNAPLTTHLPLLNWLSSVRRPRMVGVLGCDDGVAHFALCQALDRLGLDGRAQGLGFWRDPNSGKITAPPLALCRHQEMLYKGMSRLEGCETLEGALDRMPQGAFDLLLVDLTALPESSQVSGEGLTGHLAAGGVLLLHGTARLQDEDGGLRDLARFLADRTHVEFPAGGGMVLLAAGDDLPPPLQALLDAAPGGQLRRDVEQVFLHCGQGLRAMAEAVALREERHRAERKATETSARLHKAEREIEALQAAHEKRGIRLAEVQSEIFDLRQESTGWGKTLSMVEASLAKEQQARAAAEAALAKEQVARQDERNARFKETAALTRLAEQLRKDKTGLERRIHKMLNSTSWRLTAPIRAVRRRFSSASD